MRRLLPVLCPLAVILTACGDQGGPATAAPIASPETLAALAADPTVQARGKALYQTGKGFCTTCHGVEGRGATPGMNLVDGIWLHGGDLPSIRRSIADGYPDKGMRAWREVFAADEIDALAVHVHRLATSASTAPTAR